MAGRRDSIVSSESVDLPDPNMSPSNRNYQSNYSSLYGSNIEGERGYYTSVGPPSSMNTTLDYSQRSSFAPISSTADSTLQRLNNELAKLREEKRECEAQLKYANSEKDLIKSDMDLLRARASAQARIPQHLLVYIEKLKKTLAEKDRDTEKIQMDYRQKSETLERANGEIDRLNRECSDLKVKQKQEQGVMERQNMELQSLRNQLNDIEDAKLKLGGKLKSEQQKLAKSEDLVNELFSRKTTLEEENKSFKEQLTQSSSRSSDKRKLEKDLEKANKTIEDLRKQLDSKTAELKTITKLTGELAKEKEKRKGRSNDTVDTNRLTEDNSRLLNKIKELEETIQEHSNQLEAKTGVLNEVDRLRQENYELANKLQKLEKSQQLIKVSDRPKTNHNDIEDHFKKLLNLTESLENHLKTSDVARGDTRSKPEQASAGIGRHLQVALSDTVNDQLSEGRKLVRRLRNEIASLKGQIQNEENDQKSLMNDAIKERPGVPTSSSQDQSLRNNPVKYSQEEIRVFGFEWKFERKFGSLLNLTNRTSHTFDFCNNLFKMDFLFDAKLLDHYDLQCRLPTYDNRDLHEYMYHFRIRFNGINAHNKPEYFQKDTHAALSPLSHKYVSLAHVPYRVSTFNSLNILIEFSIDLSYV